MKRFLIYNLMILTAAVSCNESENNFSITPSIGFETTSGTVLESNTSGIQVSLYSNVKVKEAVTATIVMNNFQNLVYGVDFTTEPAMVGNTVTVTMPADENTTSFFVYPAFKGVERALTFNLTEVTGDDLQLAQARALSYFLTIRSLGCPIGNFPVNLSYDFNNCTTDFATPVEFIEEFEPGSKTDRGWGCRAFGVSGSRAPRASAFGGTAGDDKAWMILKNPPKIAAGASVELKFSVFSNFSGPGIVNVKWSSDYAGSGNPLLATWTDLATINSQFPAAGSAVWKDVTGTFTDICGEKVYIAFQFTGASNAASASWDIDNFSFKTN